MRGTNTIFLNGRAYNAATGQQIKTDTVKKAPTQMVNDFGPRRITSSQPIVKRPTSPSHTAVHAKTQQRSQTLNRSAIKRPAASRVSKSPAITRFAPHPAIRTVDTAPVATATPKVVAAQVTTPVTTKTQNQLLKETLIKERIAQAEAAKAARKTEKKQRSLRGLIARKPRFFGITTAVMALLIVAGYVTYLNLPNLSVRVAAAHAGFDATYPEYQPDGFSLNGPVAYEPGKSVTLNFASNTNKTLRYSLEQRASAWDSQAVQDDYVNKVAGSDFSTLSANGLTIYTFGDNNNAAWVNGGILYTISGTAKLSQDQITKIAASM